jgi:hypothetical protein
LKHASGYKPWPHDKLTTLPALAHFLTLTFKSNPLKGIKVNVSQTSVGSHLGRGVIVSSIRNCLSTSHDTH